MATITEKQKFTTEILSSRNSIMGYFAEEKIMQVDFDKLIQRLNTAWSEHNAEQKKADIDEVIALLKTKGLKISDITGGDKKRATVPLKWLRFEHDGNEYFINRSTSGRAKGALGDYMTLTGKTLPELVVDESEVDQSKVVTKDELVELSKKKANVTQISQ